MSGLKTGILSIGIVPPPEHYKNLAGKEIRVGPISFINHTHRYRPVYSKDGIVPTHTSPTFRSVNLRHLVEDFRGVFERLEPVRETLWNVKHAVVLRRQFDSDPLFERWRCRPEIDNDVVDRALGATHDFHLPMRCGLIMHSSECPAVPIK